jgi:transposase
MYYQLVKNGEEYEEAGAAVYEEKYRARVVKNLKKRAQSLGYELTPVAA